MERSVAILTIGQSPRTDLTPEMSWHWGDTSVREYGALDGLSRIEIEALAPGEGEEPLTSRLSDGSSAVFGASKILPRLGAVVARAESDGADASLVVCGSEFPPVPHGRPLLWGSDLLHDGVAALCREGNVGVVRPLESQLDDAQRHWGRTLGRPPSGLMAANPYGGDPAEIASSVSREMPDCDVVVLDCFGYDESIASAVASESTAVVILSRSIVARLMAEFLAR